MTLMEAAFQAVLILIAISCLVRAWRSGEFDQRDPEDEA
jgi:hypothetical protein